MTDNIAILDGYTKAVTAVSAHCELYLLVTEKTDLTDRFEAWDTVEQEYIMVSGWLFVFEDDEISNDPDELFGLTEMQGMEC